MSPSGMANATASIRKGWVHIGQTLSYSSPFGITGAGVARTSMTGFGAN